MAYRHAEGYAELESCEIVACADILQENADAFAQKYPGTKAYLDYKAMLAAEKLDVVSICTWPHLHAEMTVTAARAGVKAIHCEKPMATSWNDAKEMVRVCKESGAQLTFNHQRRFGDPFRKAKALLDEGAIGDLVRLEASCSNLYDWGTHWLDMLFMYNDECPARWVFGQVDPRDGRAVFGVELEGQGLGEVMWENGVRGLMITGYEAEIGCANRLVGEGGTIEVGVTNGPVLRVRGKGDGSWRVIETTEGLHGQPHITKAVADVVRCLGSGDEPVLSARKALQTTEVIFATYESSRRRARIDLPLEVEGSPFTSMR